MKLTASGVRAGRSINARVVVRWLLLVVGDRGRSSLSAGDVVRIADRLDALKLLRWTYLVGLKAGGRIYRAILIDKISAGGYRR